jgi:hypothetical protein
MEDIYYCEAVQDVNLHCDEYTDKDVRPDIWNDLVKEQINYLTVLNQLSLYLFDDDNMVLEMFSDACTHYDGYYDRYEDEEYERYYTYEYHEGYDGYDDEMQNDIINYDDVTDVTMLTGTF